MRAVLTVLTLLLLTLPAFADEPMQPTKAAPNPSTPNPPISNTPTANTPTANPRRLTWEQQFTQANLAHDGHLTLDEAKAGFMSIAKHFNDIDIERKGYVTTNDIRAWRIMRKAARRLTLPPPEKLKLQHAFQLHLIERDRLRLDQSEGVNHASKPDPDRLKLAQSESVHHASDQDVKP